ncbi:MAG: L-threonylcarbamoyladenylate synthase [Geminicoccaceae bacterium]
MEILQPTAAALERAARELRQGRLVAFPTETVYGLGADATSDAAVRSVFAAKGRPPFNPLIVHVADLRAAMALAQFDDRARRLAESFWPGPLTLVLPKVARCPVSASATAGLPTVAIRVPKHPVAKSLLVAAGIPVVAPSANPSGLLSPTTAQHVATELGDRVSLVLDGGPCDLGLESTVVDLSGPKPVLLRPGGLTRRTIERICGSLGDAEATDRPRSPGLLLRHYAPKLPLRLDADGPEAGEAYLDFGPPRLPPSALYRNLSPAADLPEAARNLFAMLRDLDRTEAAAIAVAPLPAEGLGEALRDRLRRAAHRD